jgi:hypothetical protein
LTVIFDFVKLNLYVTFSFDADKAIVYDGAHECGVSGGDFFQVVFPGVACEVGVDIFVKTFVAIPKISKSPEWCAVYIYGFGETFADISWVCNVTEFFFE